MNHKLNMIRGNKCSWLALLHSEFFAIKQPLYEIAQDLKHLIEEPTTTGSIDNSKLGMIKMKALAIYLLLLDLCELLADDPLER